MQLEKKRKKRKKNVTMAHKNGSLICTVMLKWPLIVPITLCRWTVSPTTRANSTRATRQLRDSFTRQSQEHLGLFRFHNVAWKSVTRVHCFEKLYVLSLGFYTSIVASSICPSATSTETPSHGDNYIACQVLCKGPLGMQSTFFSLYNTGTEQSRLIKSGQTEGNRWHLV